MELTKLPPYSPLPPYRPVRDDRPVDVITKEKLLSRPSPFVRMKTLDALGELKKLLEGYTDYQKLCLINRMLTDNVTYDHSVKASSYSFPTIIRTRKGVCSAISGLFFLMCESCFTEGKVYRIIGDVQKSQSDQGHAWNLVELDTPAGHGAYFVDTTWDLGKKTWDWFLFGEDAVRRTRSWESQGLPRISGTKCRAAVYRDQKKSLELTEWFRRLGSRFENGMYRLGK